MIRLIGTRIGHAAITLLAISLLVFVGTNLLPGDVADALLARPRRPRRPPPCAPPCT